MTQGRRWLPARLFADPGSVARTGLLTRPTREWGAAPHTAAALAWKAYSWWLVTPVVVAFANGRPLPRLDLDNIEVALREERPYAEFRVRDSAPFVGPGDVPALRGTLLDGHLDPVADALVATTRIGRRTLRGSVAEAVAAPSLAENDTATAERLLHGLGLAGLLRPVGGGADGTLAMRRTCCQAVSVPELGICDSCPVQRRMPAHAVAAPG